MALELRLYNTGAGGGGNTLLASKAAPQVNVTKLATLWASAGPGSASQNAVDFAMAALRVESKRLAALADLADEEAALITAAQTHQAAAVTSSTTFDADWPA